MDPVILLTIGLCALIGIALFILEVFLPGFGIPGIAGLCLLAAADYVVWSNYGSLYGILALLIILVLLSLAILIALRSVDKGKLSRSKLILQRETPDANKGNENDLTGKQGKMLTVANPVGFALIDGSRVEVLCEHGYLDKNQDVVVAKREGRKVIVRAL